MGVPYKRLTQYALWFTQVLYDRWCSSQLRLVDLVTLCIIQPTPTIKQLTMNTYNSLSLYNADLLGGHNNWTRTYTKSQLSFIKLLYSLFRTVDPYNIYKAIYLTIGINDYISSAWDHYATLPNTALLPSWHRNIFHVSSDYNLTRRYAKAKTDPITNHNSYIQNSLGGNLIKTTTMWRRKAQRAKQRVSAVFIFFPTLSVEALLKHFNNLKIERVYLIDYNYDNPDIIVERISDKISITNELGNTRCDSSGNTHFVDWWTQSEYMKCGKLKYFHVTRSTIEGSSLYVVDRVKFDKPISVQPSNDIRVTHSKGLFAPATMYSYIHYGRQFLIPRPYYNIIALEVLGKADTRDSRRTVTGSIKLKLKTGTFGTYANNIRFTLNTLISKAFDDSKTDTIKILIDNNNPINKLKAEAHNTALEYNRTYSTMLSQRIRRLQIMILQHKFKLMLTTFLTFCVCILAFLIFIGIVIVITITSKSNTQNLTQTVNTPTLDPESIPYEKWWVRPLKLIAILVISCGSITTLILFTLLILMALYYCHIRKKNKYVLWEYYKNYTDNNLAIPNMSKGIAVPPKSGLSDIESTADINHPIKQNSKLIIHDTFVEPVDIKPGHYTIFGRCDIDNPVVTMAESNRNLIICAKNRVIRLTDIPHKGIWEKVVDYSLTTTNISFKDNTFYIKTKPRLIRKIVVRPNPVYLELEQLLIETRIKSTRRKIKSTMLSTKATIKEEVEEEVYTEHEVIITSVKHHIDNIKSPRKKKLGQDWLIKWAANDADTSPNYSLMLKYEKTNLMTVNGIPKGKKSRAINKAANKFQYPMAPYIKGLTKALKYVHSMESRSFMASGCTFDDITKWFNMHIGKYNNPILISSDQTSFDCSIHKDAIAQTHRQYRIWGIKKYKARGISTPKNLANQYMKAQMKFTTVHWAKSSTTGRRGKIITVTGEGTQKSGDNDTSVANTKLLINALNYYMHTKSIIKYNCAVLGDDNLMIVEKEDYLKMNDLKEYMSSLGLTIKVSATDHIIRAEFLSGRFYYIESTQKYHFGKLPGRTLQRSGWMKRTLLDDYTKSEVLLIFKGSLLSQLAGVNHIPFVRIYFKHYIKSIKGEAMYHEDAIPYIQGTSLYECDSGTWEQFTRLYGLTRHDEAKYKMQLEKDFNKLGFSHLAKDPWLAILLKVDGESGIKPTN